MEYVWVIYIQLYGVLRGSLPSNCYFVTASAYIADWL